MEGAKYVRAKNIASKLEIKIGMFNGSHNREFCLHTMPEEIDSGDVLPYWSTRLTTEELIELRDAISDVLIEASHFE